MADDYITNVYACSKPMMGIPFLLWHQLGMHAPSLNP